MPHAEACGTRSNTSTLALQSWGIGLIKAELTEKLKKYALGEAGFDLVGVSGTLLPEIHAQALERWLAQGFAGSMDYMARSGARRADAKSVLASAVSVISLALNYHHPEDVRPEGKKTGKVAQYAYGRDYHKVIEAKLKKFSQYILECGGNGTEIKTYVDTGPLLEKAFAQAGGLGFFGKNTNIITRNFGSWVFLASVVTNLDLVADEPHTGSCGSCRICIDACPTGALLGNYEMDATRCISYLTIEAKEEPAAEIKNKMGEWVFGCDICQTVCPYNFRAKTTRHEELYPNKIAGSWADLEKIETLSDQDQFVEMFRGSAVKRPKLKGMVRNAKIAAKNAGVV